jgi:hypothetical protein
MVRVTIAAALFSLAATVAFASPAPGPEIGAGLPYLAVAAGAVAAFIKRKR